MSEIKSLTLTGTAETLLITLYIRALESQRPDALIKDHAAEALFRKIRDNGLYDFGRMKSLHLSEANKLVIILRNREFDRYTRDFLAHHLDAVVVHIGEALSHSSILAREYGIPAVMSTGVATRRIHTGQIITVDGSKGLVTLKK